MSFFQRIKAQKKPRIGLYTIGMKVYWEQFSGLKERILGYGIFLEKNMSEISEVYNYGLVDDETAARKVGEWFNENNVDLIFCHCGTYATSSIVLAVHKICKSPVVVLNLQPTAQINYERTTTAEWLAHCGSCVAPEISNAFNRAGIKFRIINGLLGLNYTPTSSMTNEKTNEREESKRGWQQIFEWVKAAGVVRNLKHSRFGFLGNTYSGMLDMYSDFTMIQSQSGIHVEVIEMCDLDRCMKTLSDSEVTRKITEINQVFKISDDSPSDPIAKKPTNQQIEWSARVAAAQEKLVLEYNLDSLTYYYHGSSNSEYEKLQGGFIVGHSLLTAKGIPCAGEGDLKTALAMKIFDMLGVGGSFCEIVVVDYADGTILLGHDGPFHIAISDEKPILRGMGVYHGKQGTGVSVEAKVKRGGVTTLNITQTIDGKLKMITSEGEATGGAIMKIGNTQTPVKFEKLPDDYMEHWFCEAPTHHFAMSIGHNASVIKKVADFLNCNYVNL